MMIPRSITIQARIYFFASFASSVQKVRHHDDKINAIICALNSVFLKPIILSEAEALRAADHNSIVPSFESHDLEALDRLGRSP